MQVAPTNTQEGRGKEFGVNGLNGPATGKACRQQPGVSRLGIYSKSLEMQARL